MQFFTAVFGMLTPVVLGAWIGSRLRRPVGAFFLGWIATPVMAIPVALVFTVLIGTPVAMIVAIELPIVSIVLGLISGSVAAAIAHRRTAIAALDPITGQATDRPSPESPSE